MPDGVVQSDPVVLPRTLQQPHTSKVAYYRWDAFRPRAESDKPTTGGGAQQDPDHWRDIQIRMEGPAVLPLQTGFAQNWLETTGELVSGFEFYPPPQHCERVTLEKWRGRGVWAKGQDLLASILQEQM